MTESMATGRAIRSRKKVSQEEWPMPIVFRVGEHEETGINIRNNSSKMQFQGNDPNIVNVEMMAKLDSLVRIMKEDDLRISEDDCRDFLNDLSQTGRIAYSGIFNDDAGKRFIGYEEEARRDNRQIEIMVFARSGFKLFWELLYPDYLHPDADADPLNFWGFRYPIGRASYEQKITDAVRVGKGFFSAVHCELDHSLHEVAELEKLIQKFAKDYELSIHVENLEKLIASLEVVSPQKLTLLFHDENFRFGILHFACHHVNPKGNSALKAFLSVTRRQEAEEIDLPLEMLLANQKFGFRYQPFVFLNACESSNPGQLFETFAFPSQLISYGAGCVIATACSVPDNFASAFGMEFYKNLLKLSVKPTLFGNEVLYFPGRASVAKALLKTRQHFLKEYNNPLGLAYGLYAQLDVQIDMSSDVE